MEVHVHEIDSTVQSYDLSSLLSDPRSKTALVQMIQEVMDRRDEHRQRVAAETRVDTSIVS